ncbi:MAG TPA: hypothetical protein VG347_05605 [Verrucomicrobiae bacterium]|nr:hypothetical protein [Verrucomicrobiae bacterium]
MNTELQPLLDLLTGKFHWLPALLAWVGALKTLFHFLGRYLTAWTSSVLVSIVNSPDPTDDHLLLTVLDSRIYQLLHFALALFSLPLPTRADYDAALKNKTAIAPATTALLLSIMMAGVAGCATQDAQAFATEQLTADTASAATSTFNLYYQSATNTADATTLARLDSARAELYSADRTLASALTVVEALRVAYSTNSATTNQAALNTALLTVQSQSSNIVTLVHQFTNKQN